MSGFEAIITKEIDRCIADGMSTIKTLEQVGGTKFPNTDLYYIPYGLYHDKVLFFKIN